MESDLHYKDSQDPEVREGEYQMEAINTLLANNLKAGQWLWPLAILISNPLITIKGGKEKFTFLKR